ncbi:MAG: S8 family serine peptidase [Crocinitomicaceae bacterium]|nr:S8 family serine peptidase [Crocinitomicaceae bacterium]
MKQLINLALALLVTFSMLAQEKQAVFFNSGEYTPKKTTVFSTKHTSKELVNGSYFRLIQFINIPTTDEKSHLSAAGIELVEYLPKKAYFARVNKQADLSMLHQYSTYSIEPIQPIFKLSKILAQENYPHWTLFGSTQIDLNARVFKGIPTEVVTQLLNGINAKMIQKTTANLMTVRIEISKLPALYALPCFSYFETLSPPAEPENLVGRTNHRSNTIASDYASGLHYDGTGITLMMQDDGYIGPHIDFKGRNDQSECNGCSTDPSDDHGDHVAGTIMGAGNIDPKARGMAFGSNLLVYSSSNQNFYDVPNLYANNSLVITSKSYSSGCNGGYDGLTRDLDEQVKIMPALIHVFSAGNSGTSDCGYGAGSTWGNITGGHKSGKNVIAVGNLNSLDELRTSSSRGPATDGRIKPDICGVGSSVYSTTPDYTYGTKTGTSMSCPGVAGSIAQLYQAYKDLNGGVNPNSGLIKAAVLNTAKDLGNPGPDFKHGWGRINVGKAYDLLASGNYQSGTLAQGGSTTHTINVPVGTTALKLMLYWTDYQGSTNAAIALVNDLDLVVTDPGFVTYEPWVLNAAANATTLDDDAIRAVDHLNNMEQVTIDNPIPGTYSIDITGFAIPEGPQEYYIVYEYGRDEVLLTYPNGGEGLNPGTSQLIRWDAVGNTSDFLLEQTMDNGASWSTIATVASDLRHYNWSIPTAVTGLAKIRVTRASSSDVSNDVFTILGTPTNLDFGWSCPDSINITWNAVAGATGYEVSMLGAKYMDSVGSSSATNITLALASTDENWFSVRALGADNARSERAIAIRKLPGEFGCTWSDPHAGMSVLCSSISSTACVQVLDESINTDAGSTYLWYFPNGNPATSTDQHPSVCYTASGMQDAALVVSNGVGSDSVYFNDYVNVIASKSLPYFEGFEAISTLSSTDAWTINNPGNNAAFEVTSLSALSGSRSVRLANHGQDSENLDELISGPIDLSGVSLDSGSVTLSFRYSYKKRNTGDDEWLRLYIAEDCEEDWTIRKTLHGNMLSSSTQNSNWYPSSNEVDWTTVHVTNITSTYFSGGFKFKFAFESDGGNNFYLDNINLYEGAPSDDIIAAGVSELNAIENLILYPNPVEHELNVQFNSLEPGLVNVSIQNLQGKRVQQHKVLTNPGSNLVMLSTGDLATGIYFLSLSSEYGIKTKTFIVK